MEIDLLVKEFDFQISEHLSHDEFRCRCNYDHCTATLICYRVGTEFEALRKLAGCPLYVTSGYRCPRHNSEIGGQQKSKHMVGRAVDLACPDKYDIEVFHKMARSAGFVYTYFDRERNFVHCAI